MMDNQAKEKQALEEWGLTRPANHWRMVKPSEAATKGRDVGNEGDPGASVRTRVVSPTTTMEGVAACQGEGDQRKLERTRRRALGRLDWRRPRWGGDRCKDGPDP
jgi:hypothetical protein